MHVRGTVPGDEWRHTFEDLKRSRKAQGGLPRRRSDYDGDGMTVPPLT